MKYTFSNTDYIKVFFKRNVKKEKVQFKKMARWLNMNMKNSFLLLPLI